LQTGVAAGQSELATQAVHEPSVPHSLPGWVAQSAFATHSTHVDSLVLHTGVLPEHSELVVQPGTQVNVRGLHMGLAAPQSELSRHATHRPVVAKHRGVAAGQSESAAHSTHCRVVGSQTGSALPQSLPVVHATQKPPVGSQLGADRGHTVASLAVVQVA
jgi:hypothetical protein